MANSALRLTLGAETTEDEVDFVIDKITESVKSLRETKSQE